jgi:hypothetical protein
VDIRKLNKDQIKKLVNSKNFPAVFETFDEKSKKLLRPYLKHKKPSISKTIKKGVETLKDWVSHGLPIVDDATYQSRLSVCQACEHWEHINTKIVVGVCEKCRCTNAKLKLATASCPLEKPKWKNTV